MTRFSWVVCSARSSLRGGMPRSNCVAPPTGATASPASAADLRAAASSSALPGCWHAAGARPSILSAVVVTGLPACRLAASCEQLQAAAGGGEQLVGIAQATRVDGVFDSLHLRHVGLAEDQRHEVFLFEADAVFATQRAAGGGAQAHDLGASIDHTLLCARHVGIPHDQGVQVPVAGM